LNVFSSLSEQLWQFRSQTFEVPLFSFQTTIETIFVLFHITFHLSVNPFLRRFAFLRNLSEPV
jgi:hypothetical protein